MMKEYDHVLHLADNTLKLFPRLAAGARTEKENARKPGRLQLY
jgi:hypothetical protein